MDPAEPIYQVKLLSALRSGDPALIHAFLSEIGKDKKSSSSSHSSLPPGSSGEKEKQKEIDTGAAALHLAIRCASLDTVALLLSHRAISPNGVHPPESGTSALHLAASLGRVDIVNILLEQESIDDTLTDAQGRSVKDVAKGREVLRAIDDSRTFLNATFRSQLRSYILSPFFPTSQPQSPPGLVALLSSPRSRYIDLSYLDDDSGTSLLHEAARRKDLRLIELAVRAGADVFVRNRKGKTAYEGAGKDDPVRVFLRQYANHDNILIHSPTNELPTLKGYLNKYTNVAKGYNTRWFVLCNGILSYYRHQEDETVASRGSISMKNAILKSSNDRLRFEVHSVPAGRGAPSYYVSSVSNTNASSTPWVPSTPVGPSAGGDSPLHATISSIPSPISTKDAAGGGVQKWYIKANHPVEAARWTTAIDRSIQHFRKEAIKEREKVGLGLGLGSSVSETEMDVTRKSGESYDSSVHRGTHISLGSIATTTSSTPGTPGPGSSQTLSSLPSFLRKAAQSGGSVVREVRDRASLSRRNSNKGWGTLGTIGGGGHATKDSVHSISVCAAGAVHALHRPSQEGVSANRGGGGAGVKDDADKDSVGEDIGAAADDEDDGTSSITNSIMRGGGQNLRDPPYETGFGLHTNSVAAQLELTMQLAASLPTLSTAPSPSPPSSLSPDSLSPPLASSSASSKSWLLQGSSVSSSKSQTNQVHSALTDSLATLQDLVRDYTKMVNERERWFRKKLSEERGRQKVWEESLKVVVKEGEDLEKELKKRSRRRGSAFLGVGFRPPIGSPPWSGGELNDREQKGETGVLKVVPTTMVIKETPTEPGTTVASPGVDVPLASSVKLQVNTDGPIPSAHPILPHHQLTALSTLSKPSRRSSLTFPTVASPVAHEDGEAGTTDEEDEFFDAIETNTLPNLVVHASLSLSPTPSHLSRVPSAAFSALFDAACYAGYEQLRTKLKLSADDRPSTSLWSVLKGSIGKDLTKISFPVFFNEPTSMLQRMAEDMEFSECLDAAAKESDPLMRIAYVAAFAMSNYSSTIGRIAKPFNPMLSETFEYVRLDKQYRYMSEQVSHHPPISACWAESPLWHYYGEVDAQNKFLGKSFEIRPTGVAHAELILPDSLGPGYPTAPPSKFGPGRVKEHYTWKKVTTNVSGFIFGSPTIDHYGDMVVTNHRTGDQCVLTFKPRGWRGKDAYEITGKVVDNHGNEVFDIAGRWNSQLVAKRCGFGGSGMLDPDMSVNSPAARDGSSSPLSGSTEFILLWRNSEKVEGSPFNLTPFAITLNDCPRKSLRPFLPPTDCRLRPDQRAFELGKYELANTLKILQEEKQRAIRRAREEGKVLPHRPRWFVAETDGDTGERVWNPNTIGEGELEYWSQRARVHKEGGGTDRWTGVDDIFIEEPEEINGL